MSKKKIAIALVLLFGLFAGNLMIWAGPASAESDQRRRRRQNPVPLGEKTYVGSEQCLRCHGKYSDDWLGSAHTKMERDVITEGSGRTVRGDFDSNDIDLSFGLDEVDMVIGSRFKQRYAQLIDDDYYVLPAQWNMRSREWVNYQPKKDWWAAEGLYSEDWDWRPMSKLCQGCHTTGFNVETNEPIERNIGCEACHGPGSNHAQTRSTRDIINPSRLNQEQSSQVCFQCHLRGRPPKGEFEKFAWPVGYKPGENLKDYWVYSKPTGQNAYAMWADGYASKNRVQGNTFLQSKMYKKGMTCISCHDAHGSRHTAMALKSTTSNALCLTCHGENSPHAVFKNSLSEHTHHPVNARGSRCIECHMPKTAKNAVEWDARDHSFKFISPLTTLRTGTPNPCNNCHPRQSPDWAYKRIINWSFNK